VNTPSPNDKSTSLTRLLKNWKSGDSENAGAVIENLYPELHHLAARMLSRERPEHTLQPTALIHELYLRFRSGKSPDWSGRTHFFAVAATTFRRILIDHARAHRAQRRGGTENKVPVELVEIGVTCSYDDLLIVDEALSQLERADSRAARVTELRFFAGLQESEIAKELNISEITVKRDWKFARAWLASYLKIQSQQM
jgi:RNA polymerase sigma-70 factor, ECF subfamily